jgi:hypothetical protein
MPRSSCERSTCSSAPTGRFLPRYRKTLHGAARIGDLGLELVRARCPHFGEWLAWLEQVADFV